VQVVPVLLDVRARVGARLLAAVRLLRERWPAVSFVAPASKVLTVLHRPDPSIPAVETGPDPADGATVCGLPMLRAENWLPVERREGDRLCPGCDGAGRPEEVGLW